MAGREAPSNTSRPFPNLRSWRKEVGAICDNKGREESPYLSLREPRRTARDREGGGRCGGSAARTRAPEHSRRPARVDEAHLRRPRRPRARKQQRNAGSPPSSACPGRPPPLPLRPRPPPRAGSRPRNVSPAGDLFSPAAAAAASPSPRPRGRGGDCGDRGGGGRCHRRRCRSFS